MKDTLFELFGFVGVLEIIIALIAATLCCIVIIVNRTSLLADYLYHRRAFLKWRKDEKLRTGTLQEQLQYAKRQYAFEKEMIQKLERGIELQEMYKKESKLKEGI